MALVQNLIVTPRPQGVDASWTLPSLGFPGRLAGLQWELRAGHSDTGTLLASQEWPRSYDRIKRFARNANNDRMSGFVTEDGHAYWWGRYGHHLPDNGDPPAYTPEALTATPLQIALDGVVDMVHGEQHTLLLKSDGTVWGYGMATKGELMGSLTRNVPFTQPVQLTSGATAIAASGRRSFALLSNGNVATWGAGGAQSGRNSSTDTFLATVILSGVTLIDGSPFGVAAWAPNHATPGLYAWGNQPVVSTTRTYPLPLPSMTDGSSYPTPTRSTLVSGASSIYQVAMGPNGGVLRASSALYPWGANSYGELGLGSNQTNLEFNPSTRSVSGYYNHVVMGRRQSLAIKTTVIPPSGSPQTSYLYAAGTTYDALGATSMSTSFSSYASVVGQTDGLGSATIGTADKHAFWVGDYATGFALSAGDNAYSLLARDVQIQPSPWLGVPARYKRRSDLPTTRDLTQGLQTSSPYRVRVRLDTGDGVQQTAIADTTTLLGYAAPDLTVNENDRSLTLTWSPAESTDPVTDYQLKVYHLDGSTSVLVVDQLIGHLMVENSLGNGYAYTVDGLLNGETYEVWLKGVTDTEELTWAIEQGTPDWYPAAVTAFTSTLVPSVGVQLDWTPPATHPNDGQLVGYEVSVEVDTATGPHEVALAGTFSAHTGLLLPMSAFYGDPVLEAELLEGSAWAFSVRALSTRGAGTWSPLSTPTLELVDYPAAPQQFRATNTEERFDFAWNSPIRSNFSGFRFQYRPYGELNWTVQNLPGNQRTLVLSKVERGTLYEVQLISTNGDLESAPVTVQVTLREPDAPTITFRGSGTELSLPDPNSADLLIPGSVAPILTQSGFFLPVQAIDDMEASWSLRWSALPQRLVGPLETLQGLGTLTMTDPLDLVTFGYIENVDYQGVPGHTDKETGEALYEASAEFRVIRMELPALLGVLPDGEHALEDRFGISAQGTPPLAVGGDYMSFGEVEGGWFSASGGDPGPWGDHISPSSDVWDRSVRTPPTAPNMTPVEGEPPPISDWPASWLELDASTMPPERGTAYLGVLPLEAATTPVEVEDPLADELQMTTAPGAYFGYWDTLDADRFISGLGACTIRHELVAFDLPLNQQLPLGVHFTLLDPDHRDTLRYRQQFGVATRYLEQLPTSGTPSGALDADGQPRPGRGIYVRRDLRRTDGTLVERRYLPPQWRYDSRDLYPTGETHNERVFVLHTLTSSLRTQIQADPSHPYGAQLLADEASLFGWLDLTGPSDFNPLDIPWSPGRAGPYERVLMGSGKRDSAGWLVYAIDRSLIVEFWRDDALVATRALDLTELTESARSGDRYLVALGYDYRRGRVALGVSRRGAIPHHVYRSWSIPELIGHGYRDPVLYLGAVPVAHADGATYSKSSWARVRPVDNAFVREGFLTPGRLANLMEHLP